MQGRSNANLSEQVYEKIVTDLINGKLPPGTKLTEGEMATKMKISRAPVREAFQRLAEGGLLTLIPRTCCVVSTISEQEIIALYEIRKRIESLALELAFGRFDMNRLIPLRKEFLAYNESSFPHSFDDYVASDLKFHSLIIETVNVATITDILKRIHIKVEMFRLRGKSYGKARFRSSRKEHIDILNAIVDGKKSEAVNLLELHIENTKKQVLEHELKLPCPHKTRGAKTQ
jgi:DNA-binding GntR family transcriptional regulator